MDIYIYIYESTLIHEQYMCGMMNISYIQTGKNL